MEYYKNDREFALLSPATRLALLDDFFEIDKCFFLSRIICNIPDLNSNSKLTSSQGQEEFLRPLRPREQNKELAEELRVRSMGDRCVLVH